MVDKNQKPLQEAPIIVKGEIKTPQETEQLNEFKLSWAGKLFFAGAAAFILGKNIEKMNIPIKLRGSPDEIRAVVDAIMSSKKFQQELNRPGATIDSVIDKLQIRNLSKEQYRKITGLPWPI